jgi:uncharacterized protein
LEDDGVSELMPMFPLSTVVFPHVLLPLHVFEDRYRSMLKECLEDDRRFGVVLISRGSEVGGGDERTSVGTVCRIHEASWLSDGRAAVIARGTDRLRVVEWLEDDPFPRAVVETLQESSSHSDVGEALGIATASVRRARALLSELRDVPLPAEDLPSDALLASWSLCEQAPIATLDRQRLIECDDLQMRLMLVAQLARDIADDLAQLLASS